MIILRILGTCVIIAVVAAIGAMFVEMVKMCGWDEWYVGVIYGAMCLVGILLFLAFLLPIWDAQKEKP